MLDNIIGVNEASEISGLSPGTIKNYCAEGKITSKKIGKTWVIDKSKLEEMFKMEKITFEGKEYTLTQQAYIDGPADETPVYKATAEDQEGNVYEVIWDVVDNWEEIDDEQEMVEDWDSPVSVERV